MQVWRQINENTNSDKHAVCPALFGIRPVNGLYFLSGKNQEIQWGVRESIQSVAVTLNAIVEENGLSAGLTKVKNMLWKMQERNSYLVGLQVYQERDHALLLNWNVSLERVIPLMSKTDNYKELNIVHNDILGSNYSTIATMGTSTNGMIFKGFLITLKSEKL